MNDIHSKFRDHVKSLQNHAIPESDRLFCGGLGLTEEAGEVAGLIKKHRFQGHDLDKDAMRSELGDVLWYVQFICMNLDLTIEECMQMNISKLTERYKDGFKAEASINRKQ